MCDNYRIVDYSVQLNDVIQLIDRETSRKDTLNDEVEKTDLFNTKTDTNNISDIKNKNVREISCTSKYYKKGDRIDFIHNEHGSWYEGIIVDIVKIIAEDQNINSSISEAPEMDLFFKVKMDM